MGTRVYKCYGVISNRLVELKRCFPGYGWSNKYYSRPYRSVIAGLLENGTN
jgi:hypothetical protein